MRVRGKHFPRTLTSGKPKKGEAYIIAVGAHILNLALQFDGLARRGMPFEAALAALEKKSSMPFPIQFPIQFKYPLGLLSLVALVLVIVWGWPARGYGRKREVISLAIRVLLVLCLSLAIAGFEIRHQADELAVVFLVDFSDSMPERTKKAAFQYVQQALEGMRPDDQAAVVLFGQEALVDRPMSPERELQDFITVPTPSETDLDEAIRLGLALFPPGGARRMIILSDGGNTLGDPASAARLAASSGVDLIFVPFTGTPGKEALVTSVKSPTRLLQGENFNLQVALEATEPMQATLRVSTQGETVLETPVSLERGNQTLSLALTAGKPGFASYQVQIIPEQDRFYQNNELAAFSMVSGPPRVLLVAPPAGETLPYTGESRPDEFSQLVDALTATGMSLKVVHPNGLPSELALLSEYASVILVDVPARDLTNRQMEALQSYVRDMGGGLVAIGGPTSYGVGGYFRTPLESILPVGMEVKNDQRRPTLTMVFIIDHSGSMSEASGGVTKLELAKEAAARSVDLLFPSDRVGIIAFDESAEWVVPLTDLSDPAGVINAIGSIRSGGGTDILAGLQAMARVLPGDPANLRHVILLTDGGADPTGIPELVAGLYRDYGITLTTVGVGRDAAPFLADIASLGGGRYHFAENPDTIPSIFTEETTLATRAYIIEETFFPLLTSHSPILSGISETPPLHGYVGTSPKNTAETILTSPAGDPILAAWQYGLGKAVAFTSDASPRWARDWVAWSQFPGFWAQAVRYTINEQKPSALAVQVEKSEETARLVVVAQNERGLSLNNFTMRANVISPRGEVTRLDLSQVAPGQYEGIFLPAEEGAYLIRIDGDSPDGSQTLSEVTGWVRSYSPEYRPPKVSPEIMGRLLTQAGGRITAGTPAEAFDHSLAMPVTSRPIWPWLLSLAAFLLPLDVAIRRLALSRRDFTRGLSTVFARLRPAPGEGTTSIERPEHMAALLQAKARTRRGHPVEDTPLPTRIPETTKEPAVSGTPGSRPSAGKAPTETARTERSAESTTEKLLEFKRARSRRKRE